VKKRLASRLVTLYHGGAAAEAAQRDFEAQFSRREIPEHLEEFHRADITVVQGDRERPGVVDFLVAGGLAATKSAARRLVEQGAISIDGERIRTIDAPVDPDREFVLRAGRKMKRYRPDRS
jgi:tyrosyl-tRNA synthetase